MKFVAAALGLSATLIIGCAAQPEQVPGAGGIVIDTYGVNMRQYQVDLADCKSLAYATRADEGRRGITRAAGGALLGGALGAIIGDTSSAAAAGAGAGAVLGGVSGAGSAHVEADRITKNCLLSRGYRVLN
ncbi:glycine zipper family protein [Microbulbifer thermotolerans]|uniref:Glycine zipper family protein n=1 Tax=Microbulbifer thermotolerans TaxID=252514 RepID=A0AB35HY40_MICTH|nr:glycine zipper family protein [Microbulbifer thermotolerans]MCX2779957.1 glycine zipper family protein [Microbulbifer thermotolerans]MCX2801784.1 glycine zipper family protein [Microbulbifer thermotolerans]MCX2805380.1 glycine zipper family protein [Microbulbifer thermotolerans]MCX2842223.1 glycine zipper family protein [Microbulbifer thermotolerans]